MDVIVFSPRSPFDGRQRAAFCRQVSFRPTPALHYVFAIFSSRQRGAALHRSNPTMPCSCEAAQAPFGS